jgi:hypothetical protein
MINLYKYNEIVYKLNNNKNKLENFKNKKMESVIT